MRHRIRDRVVRVLARLHGRRASARRLGDRVLEGMREVGVLLIAFAPLDAAVAVNEKVTRSVLLSVCLGCFLFLGALIIDWRRDDDI